MKGGDWPVRSCLVAEEFATGVRYDTFAGSPTVKAVKLGLILATTDLCGTKAEQKLLGLFTVHVASSTSGSTARR